MGGMGWGGWDGGPGDGDEDEDEKWDWGLTLPFVYIKSFLETVHGWMYIFTIGAVLLLVCVNTHKQRVEKRGNREAAFARFAKFVWCRICPKPKSSP
jgi:hypothetical protein